MVPRRKYEAGPKGCSRAVVAVFATTRDRTRQQGSLSEWADLDEEVVELNRGRQPGTQREAALAAGDRSGLGQAASGRQARRPSSVGISRSKCCMGSTLLVAPQRQLLLALCLGLHPEGGLTSFSGGMDFIREERF
jgi:hypothetical protein